MIGLWTWLDANPGLTVSLVLVAGILLGGLEWARADKARRRESRRALRRRWGRY